MTHVVESGERSGGGPTHISCVGLETTGLSLSSKPCLHRAPQEFSLSLSFPLFSPIVSLRSPVFTPFCILSSSINRFLPHSAPTKSPPKLKRSEHGGKPRMVLPEFLSHTAHTHHALAPPTLALHRLVFRNWLNFLATSF